VIAIDTNVLLRYLLCDDELQARKASKLINGDEPVFVSHTVLVETIWTLVGKKYKVTPTDVHQTILDLLSEENILFQNAEIVWRALSDFLKFGVDGGIKIDFPDALIYHEGKDAALFYEESFNGFYTFDRAAQSLPDAMTP